jgi:hypothetical protein
VRAAPAHAGSLSPWERLAFALAFALMAAFVVIVTVVAARAHERGPRPAPSAAGGRSHSAAGGTGPGAAAAHGSGSGPASPDGVQPTFVAASDQQLAAALAPVLVDHTGHIAVGVIDRTTGAAAVYDGRQRFHTASIVKADILASLLLQDQRTGTSPDGDDRALAGQMIEDSDDDAASDLWDEVGEGTGVAEANKVLGLRDTTPGTSGYWGLTSTTVPDQLRLLTDLTSASSPLSAASRSYELGLMRHVQADQAWGVTAAAAAGTSPAVKNGWLPDPVLWVINSIGVIRCNGQQVLVAVLSDDQPTESAGIAQDQEAAKAAVTAIITGRS